MKLYQRTMTSQRLSIDEKWSLVPLYSQLSLSAECQANRLIGSKIDAAFHRLELTKLKRS